METINHFYTCLKMPNRAPSGTWQAAMYLYYVYDEIGRKAEAQRLYDLATEANKQVGWSHEPSLERDVRQLASVFAS